MNKREKPVMKIWRVVHTCEYYVLARNGVWEYFSIVIGVIISLLLIGDRSAGVWAAIVLRGIQTYTLAIRHCRNSPELEHKDNLVS